MDETPMTPSQVPVIAPGHTMSSVTDQISSIVLTSKTPRWWLIGFAVTFSLTMLLFYSAAVLVMKGIGIWGVNIPVGLQPQIPSDGPSESLCR